MVEAAPGDPVRQMRLGCKLFTAVIASFLQKMPSLAEEHMQEIVRFAFASLVRVEEQRELVEPDDDIKPSQLN